MTDPDTHALTGPYVLNALPGFERERFERHLAACEFCQAEVAELREAATKLAQHVATPPPPALKARVLAAVDQTRQLPFPATPDSARASGPAPGSVADSTATAGAVRGSGSGGRTVSRRSVFSLAAAALAAALGGGIAIDQYREKTAALEQANRAAADAARASEQADRVAAVLAQPDARTVHAPVAGGGQATVVTSLRTNTAVIVLRGLHDLPPDRTWQLWLIDTSRTAHSIALTPTDLTHVTTTDLADKTTFGLTIEPTGGSPRPTLPTAAQVPLA